MSKIIINVSISLDVFVAGPTPSASSALGVGGKRLHDWLFNRITVAARKRHRMKWM
jgi:hypothetical protein